MSIKTWEELFVEAESKGYTDVRMDYSDTPQRCSKLDFEHLEVLSNGSSLRPGDLWMSIHDGQLMTIETDDFENFSLEGAYDSGHLHFRFKSKVDVAGTTVLLGKDTCVNSTNAPNASNDPDEWDETSLERGVELNEEFPLDTPANRRELLDLLTSIHCLESSRISHQIFQIALHRDGNGVPESAFQVARTFKKLVDLMILVELQAALATESSILQWDLNDDDDDNCSKESV